MKVMLDEDFSRTRMSTPMIPNHHLPVIRHIWNRFTLLLQLICHAHSRSPCISDLWWRVQVAYRRREMISALETLLVNLVEDTQELCKIILGRSLLEDS